MKERNREVVHKMLKDLLKPYELDGQVAAGKIVEIRYPTSVCSSFMLLVDNGNHDEVAVPVRQQWIDEHKPAAGGYFVVDDKGNQVFVADKVFTGHYKALESIDMSTDSHYELGE